MLSMIGGGHSGIGKSCKSVLAAPLFSVLFSFVAHAGNPATPFVITPALKEVSLGPHLDILEDPSGDYSIEDFSDPEVADQFIRSVRNEPGFGFTKSVYWARLAVENRSDESIEWYLEAEYPLIDSVDLYIPTEEDDYEVRRYGDLQPFDSREFNYRNIIFSLEEAPRSQRTYFLRFETSSSMNMALKYWQPEQFTESAIREEIVLGIYYGALVTMLILNTLMFFVFRDISYFYYVLFFSTWGLAQLSINGLAYQFLWPDAITWANINIPVFMFAAIASFNQWGRSNLNMGVQSPKLDLSFRLLTIVSAIGMIMAFLVPYALSVRTGAGLAAIAAILWLVASTVLSKRGQRSARFFLMALSLYYVGVVTFVLKTFGWLPGNFLTNWSIQFGAFAALVLFTLSTTDRILQALIQSEEALEKEVSERTRELVMEKKKSEDASAAKSRFLAYMSHEIRTPMNGVLGMARLLRDTRLERDQQQMAKTISESGESLLHIVNEILDMSKLEAGQIELELVPFSVTNLAGNVFSVMGPMAREKGLDLRMEIDPSLPMVMRGDPLRLRQVLTNLVSNAVKFTQSGTVGMKITLVTMSKDTAHIEYAVSDTGKGISPAQQEKLFAPYSQAGVEVARLHGGTGLGLYICRQLVQMMGGEISVQSQVGKGSIFRFDIPLAIDNETGAEKLDRGIVEIDYHDVRLPTRLLTVLQIEDNETNRDVVESILKNHGHRILSVGNGREALDLINTHQHRFDAILTDRHMPEMDGIEATRRIREMGPPFDDLPIIGITASVISYEKEQCLAAGMNAVISKPVSTFELLSSLASLTEKLNGKNSERKELPVLVVDDVETNLDLARRQLRQLCVDCELFQDSREALKSAKSGRYGAVLLDNSMPEMDGAEFTRQLRLFERERDRRTPIIVVTGDAAPEDRKAYLNSGMDHCLEKPVALDALKRALESWIRIPDRDDATPPSLAEPRSERSVSSPVDYALMAEILGSGDTEALTEVVQLFVEHFPEMLKIIREAVEANSRVKLREAAHAAKSAASSAAAIPLRELLQRLEKDAEKADWEQIGGLTDAIQREFQAVVDLHDQPDPGES